MHGVNTGGWESSHVFPSAEHVHALVTVRSCCLLFSLPSYFPFYFLSNCVSMINLTNIQRQHAVKLEWTEQKVHVVIDFSVFVFLAAKKWRSSDLFFVTNSHWFAIGEHVDGRIFDILKITNILWATVVNVMLQFLDWTSCFSADWEEFFLSNLLGLLPNL